MRRLTRIGGHRYHDGGEYCERCGVRRDKAEGSPCLESNVSLVLTDEKIEALADEAERGYDVKELRPVSDERREALRRHVREAREETP